VRQHRLQQRDGLKPHAGGALAEARELERHHQPHVRRRHRLAHAGGMRQHDIALERREIGGADAHAGELAEAGIDAVDRRAARDDGFDCAGARLDRRQRGGIEPGGGAVGYGAPVGERRVSRLERDRHSLLRTRR
jgi:hypothetical protein